MYTNANENYWKHLKSIVNKKKGNTIQAFFKKPSGKSTHGQSF